MPAKERSIFVAELIDMSAFAFEAEHTSQAEEFAHAPWFVRAVSSFHRQSRRLPNERVAVRTRPATEQEASLYRDLAIEFADEARDFLVAPLPGH